jgi:hypothetical protein
MIIKMFRRLFLPSCFTNGICSYNFYRVFDGASFEKRINMLSFSEAEMCAKYESFLNIFIMLGSTITYFLLVLSMQETIERR